MGSTVPSVEKYIVNPTRYPLSDGYTAMPGTGYDGVVYISANGSAGTGTLLYDGRAVLTAGHVVDSLSAEAVSVTFFLSDGLHTVGVRTVEVHPNYTPESIDNDIAILLLEEAAPAQADRYDINRHADVEAGGIVVKVGFGLPGTGENGVDRTATQVVKRFGENTYDFAANAQNFGTRLDAVTGSADALVYDFDDGSPARDAAGFLLGRQHTGLGQAEVNIAPGDSGGPGFIEGRIAGVSSYALGGYFTDIDNEVNSTFGEFSVDTRVSSYANWIDRTVQEALPHRPHERAETEMTVAENGNSAYKFVYFFLEISTDLSILSYVNYQTRDGTARAGEDFVAARGEAVIYPGERSVVIPVEILDDDWVEGDEDFFLVLTDPVGAMFPEGATQLMASRTIVDDDLPRDNQGERPTTIRMRERRGCRR